MLPRVVITIAIEDLATARRDCLRVPATAYAVELRCDYCSTIAVDQVAELMSLIHVPCIITLRPARQGGKYLGDEADRIALLASLLSFFCRCLRCRALRASCFRPWPTPSVLR